SGVGLAIDYLRSLLDPAAPAAKFPFGWNPPSAWNPMRVLWLLAGFIFAAATLRAWLFRANAIAVSRLGQRRIVVALRTQVFEKMHRLSCRSSDASATGSLTNRVTGHTQAVRPFSDGVVM